MAHSVEGRFPFLDHRVVDFCCALPARFKLRGLREKHLLREVAAPMLPREIWTRRKRPYRAPVHRSFFHESTPDYLPDLLSESQLKAAGLFKPEAVSQLLRKVRAGGGVGETDDMAIAGIISAQLCWQLFVTRTWASEPLGKGDDVKIVLHRP